MHGGTNSRQFDSWKLRGYPQVVEYSVPVLDGIVAEVVSAYQKFPHGGLAVGGVLFGEGDKHLVRILGARAIPCDHAAGPSFTLSPTDHEALQELLDRYEDDPELSGLIPVGWYHSHTRSGLNFTPSDLEVHQRHFPEPWQIAVVLRPDADRPTAAGIFTRREDGGIPSQPALHLDNIRAGDNGDGAGTFPSHEDAESEGGGSLDLPFDDPEPLPAAGDSQLQSEPLPEAESDPGSDLQQEEEVVPAPSFGEYDGEKPSAASRRKLLARVAAAIVIASTLFVAYRFLIPQEYWSAVRYYAGQTGAYLSSCVNYWNDVMMPAPPPQLGLRALSNGNDLLIRWDSTSGALIGATGGMIEVNDRTRTVSRALTVEELSQGSYHFRRHSSDVRVRLTVDRESERPPYTEVTRFVSAAPTLEETNPDAKYQSVEEARAELERLRTQLLLQAEQTRSLESTLEALQEIPDNLVTAPSDSSTFARTQPPAAPPVREVEVPEPPAPTLQQPSAPPAQSPPTQSAPTPAPVKPAPPKPAAPASGRILWTGYLRPGQVLTFANGRPSTGSASGSLPGSPITFAVFPGELTGSGLTVFSNQRQHAGVTEAPSARNSWNRTTFEYRPGQTSSISVVEAPSAANRWSRLAIRAEGRALSVVVISWNRTDER